MKRFAIILFAVTPLLAGGLAHAEDVSAVTVTNPTKLGVKAGLSSSTLFYSGTDRDVNSSLQRRLAGSAALFLTRRINDNLGLQLEAMISDRGAQLGAGADPTSIELRYLTVPLLLRYDLAPSAQSVRPFVMAGASLGVLLSARSEGSAGALDLEATTRQLELAGVLTAGIEVPHRNGAATFELRYGHGFSDVVHGVDGQAAPSVRNRVISVLVGYVM